jgi:hypothetical protein
VTSRFAPYDQSANAWTDTQLELSHGSEFANDAPEEYVVDAMELPEDLVQLKNISIEFEDIFEHALP